MRELRARRSFTLQDQASQLGVSKAYISALETGNRGRPTGLFVDQVCVWLGLIWDEAEELKELAAVSHPKPRIDARTCGPAGVQLANLLANNIGRLNEAGCRRLTKALKKELDVK